LALGTLAGGDRHAEESHTQSGSAALYRCAWALHCHLLYHMEAGMFATLRYV
jgi:FtsP/CotA-like multicopper oxidase with cupredoxin domain